jgi:transcriptional regulator of heat shock response
MKGLSQRQEDLLGVLIKDYIDTAKPVSSKRLQKKYNLDVCSATLRGEMQKLSERGYLRQPHISSGRVPTNKAYRFFVDRILKEDWEESPDICLEELKGFEQDIFKFTELVTRALAKSSSSLVIACLLSKGLLWEEGWEDVFQIPEFEERAFRNKFVREAESLKKKIRDFSSLPESIDVYVGKEGSILGSQDISLIITKSSFPDKEEGMIAVLGPNRMPYDKNISTINSLINLLNYFND